MGTSTILQDPCAKPATHYVPSAHPILRMTAKVVLLFFMLQVLHLPAIVSTTIIILTTICSAPYAFPYVMNAMKAHPLIALRANLVMALSD